MPECPAPTAALPEAHVDVLRAKSVKLEFKPESDITLRFEQLHEQYT
jgi:hypothetical protein